MDKRILRVVELVNEANSKGEYLVLELTPSQLDVRNKNNRFKSVVNEINEGDILSFSAIYFDEWFEEFYDFYMDSLIKKLERYCRKGE